MRVRYTLRAQADLDAIYTYLDARAPVAAQSVKTLIERRIAMLAEFPASHLKQISPESMS